MTEVILERNFEPGVTVADVQEMAVQAGGCFSLYRMSWQRSFLAADGRRMLCWFTVPDVESARAALRQVGVGEYQLWSPTVHDAGDGAPSWREANVLVERCWDEPVALADIQAIEDAGARCLETYRVRFARTFFASDRKRMACLYLAPDAESVRAAQRQAGMTMESVWSFEPVDPITS